MTLSWDAEDERVVIEVFPVAEVEVELAEPRRRRRIDSDRGGRARGDAPRPDAAGDRPGLRASAPRRSSRPAGRRARSAGPIDPDGHLCPRANGFRRPRPERRWPHRAFDAREGSWSLHGRIMPASNAHLPRRATIDGVQVRLQADRRGAAAVGLPRRHPGRPRGRGVRRVRGARLGRGAADRAARRPARPRDGPGCGGSPTSDAGRRSTLVPAGAGARRAVRTSSTASTATTEPVSLVHEDTAALRRMAVFDVVVNNADRKGGHVLPMADGHRYGVDHGVTLPHRGQAPHGALGLGRRAARRDEERAGVERRARRARRRRSRERARRAPHRARGRRARSAAASGCCAAAGAGAARGLARDPVAAVLSR